MSDIGRVRIRVPSSIKAGDIVRVKTLVIHPMERLDRDAQRRIVQRPYKYLTKMTVTYLGRTVLALDTTQSVSENPIFAFTFRATEPGPLRITFTDTTGAKYEGAADIRFS